MYRIHKLEEKIHNQDLLVGSLRQENQQLKEIINEAINKVQYIIDYGFDYDGFNKVDRLKGLIDMLVDYARQTKKILKGEENE